MSIFATDKPEEQMEGSVDRTGEPGDADEGGPDDGRARGRKPESAEIKRVPLPALDLSDRRCVFKLIHTDVGVLRAKTGKKRLEPVEVLARPDGRLVVIDGMALCEVLRHLRIPTVVVRIFAGLTVEEGRARAMQNELKRVVALHGAAVRTFVHAECYAFLRAKEEVDDLVGEVWLKAMKQLPRLEDGPYEAEVLRGRICGMAQSTIKDEARFWTRRKRSFWREEQAAVDMDLLAAVRGLGAVAPEEEAMRQERLEVLWQAFDQLPPDKQQVIRMARLEGRSWALVAAAMGRSVASVKGLLRRAVAELRQALDRLEDR